MTPTRVADDQDREQTHVRFARLLHRHGVRHATEYGDDDFPGLSQTMIANELQVSRPTVSALVGRAARIITNTSAGIKLDPTKTGVAIGVDFGQAHHRVALADIHGQLYEPKVPSKYETNIKEQPASVSLKWAAEKVKELLEDAKVEPTRVCAFGVSLPGPVNARTKRLQASGSTMDRSWEVVDIRLAKELQLPPPTVESDYNASTLTEHLWGALRDRSDALYVKVSHRCACGLLVNHRIYRGADGLAGRLGQTVIRKKGEPDRWLSVEEAFSMQGFAKRWPNLPAVEQLVESTVDNEELAEAMRDGARALGVALAPIIDALNPEAIVIGGTLGVASLSWVAADLLDGITSLDNSAARETVSGRLVAAALSGGTAVRGAIASALLQEAPARLAAVMPPAEGKNGS